MNDWEKFNETSLPEKEDFNCHFYMEDITDADYRHAKRVCTEFETEHLGEYHDLYVQSDTLLLADVFENYRNISLQIYELDPAKFLSAPKLAWQVVSNNGSSKIRSFNRYRLVTKDRKGIRRGIFILFIDMQKLIINS